MSQEFYTNPRNYLFEHLEIFALGAVTLIFMIVTVIVAFKMIKSFIRLKEKLHLYASITYFGLAACWSGVALNFIIILIFNQIPPMEIHFLFHGSLAQLANFCWISFMANAANIRKEVKRLIILFAGIIAIIVEIIYITIIFTDWRILGTLVAPIQVDYAVFSEIYLATHLFIFTIPGLWFSLRTMKIDDIKIKLKGKLLFASFFMLIFACILEVFLNVIFIFIIARIFVTISSILFYGGFILPKWMERLFLKQKFNS